MLKQLFLLLLNVLLSGTLFAQTSMRPFPQHTKYISDNIRPSDFTQKQLDDTTIAFYEKWKKHYLVNNCSDKKQYYVYDNEDRNWGILPGTICVSEGQGYGMMIIAVMAGYDKDAKKYFDGMFRFCREHPSSVNRRLMSWNVLNGCKTYERHENNFSATDGDLDIAFALLMADKQWGSKGTINYKQEGIDMINAIMKYEINPKEFTVMLSDALEEDDPKYFDTRSSDFIPDHFRAFWKATHDSSWIKVRERCFQIIDQMQTKFSPKTGLIPDFILYRKTNNYRPATAKYLESNFDGHYYYNACRFPFRLACDYLVSGDIRSKIAVSRINQWIRTKVREKPDQIYAGYYLSGKNIPGNDYSTPSFLAPLTVSAMTDPGNQEWFNSMWNYLLNLNFEDYKYYDNTLEMLCMIVISGNYWTPE